MIDLYTLTQQIDSELLQLDIFWAAESAQGTIVEGVGLDYRGITKRETDALGQVIVPVRFGSQVDVIIRRNGAESEPITLNTPEIPGQERYYGVVFPTLSSELTSLTALTVDDEGDPLSEVQARVSNQQRLKIYGPFTSDSEGISQLVMGRSEEPGVDLDDDGVTGELYSYLVSFVSDGVAYHMGPINSPTTEGQWHPDPHPDKVYTLSEACLTGYIRREEGTPVSSGTLRAGDRLNGFGGEAAIQPDGHFEIRVQRSEASGEDHDQDGVLGEVAYLTLVVDDGENEFTFAQIEAPETHASAGCVELDDMVTEDRMLRSGEPVTGVFDIPEKSYAYTIEVLGERVLEVDLTNAPATSSPVQYLIRLQDESGRVLQSDIALSGTRQTSTIFGAWYIARRGLYTLRVINANSSQTDLAPFTLNVNIRTVSDADYEPNSNRQQATELTLNQPFEGYIDFEADQDFYSIIATGEQLIQASLTSEFADFSMILAIYDSTGTNLCFETIDLSPPISLVKTCYLPEAGEYFIRVNGYLDNYSLTLPYTLTVNTLPVPDADQEPDNTRATAYQLQSGVTHSSYLSYENDDDFYIIEADGERLLELNVATEGDDLKLMMEILTPEGALLPDCPLFNDLNPPTQHIQACYLSTAGTYYIKMSTYLRNQSLTSTYSLTATLIELLDADQEPNENEDSAIALTPSTPHAGYLSFDRDEDYYSIISTEERVMRVDLTSDSESLQQVVIYYSARDDNQPFSCAPSSDFSPPIRITQTCYLPQGDTYFYKVITGNDSRDYLNPYLINYALYPLPDADREPENNNSDGAVELGASGTAQGWITHKGDEDYFSVTVTEPREVEFSLSSTSESLGLMMTFSSLTSGTGFSCGSAISLTRPANLSKTCTLPAADTYLVRIIGTGVGYDLDIPYTLMSTPITTP